MKATQLDDVLDWYHEASNELRGANDALKRKKNQCHQHKRELDKCEKLFQFYLEMDEKKRKMDALKKELAYSLFCIARNDFDDHVKKLEQIISKIAEFKETITRLEDEKNGLSHMRDTVENDIEKNKDVGENIQKEIGKLKETVKNAKMELKKIQSNKDIKMRSKNEKERGLQAVQKVMEENAKKG